VVNEEEGKRYHTSGVPDKDEVISPVEFDDKLAACFEFGETVWNYRFNGRTETIRCALNVVGDYVLESGSARLTARIKDRTFYTLDYSGGADSVLFYMHLGLARVPFVSDNAVFWKDQLDLRPLLKPWAAMLLDLIGPFVGYPLAQVECRMAGAGEGGVEIASRIEYRIPQRFLRRACPEQISIRLTTEGVEQISCDAENDKEFMISRSSD